MLGGNTATAGATSLRGLEFVTVGDTAANLKEKTAALLDAAQQIGSAISKRDAQRVARELSNPETIELLMRLQQALYAVATDLKQLSTTK